MIDVKTVNIHGKEYVPVSERVRLILDDHDAKKGETVSIATELIATEPVTFKATVNCKKGTFTGYSAAYSQGMIEKSSPYEVAETSAIGRALGFAGYGIVEGIASADEVVKATSRPQYAQRPEVKDPEWVNAEKNDAAIDHKITNNTKLSLFSTLPQKGKTITDLHNFMQKTYKTTVVNDLTEEQGLKLLARINKLADKTVTEVNGKAMSESEVEEALSGK